MEAKFTKVLAAIGVSIAALLAFAPRSTPAVFGHGSGARAATVSFASSPPRPGRPMHWFHSRATVRSLESYAGRFGSTAFIGLESMRDLAR
jgi:hypothetical protein